MNIPERIQELIDALQQLYVGRPRRPRPFRRKKSTQKSEGRIAMQLDNGYKLVIIDHGKPSPMQNHLGGEIAVDDAKMTMYAWRIFVMTYGIESILKACNTYKPKKEKQHENSTKKRN